jgi:hypothetical protein
MRRRRTKGEGEREGIGLLDDGTIISTKQTFLFCGCYWVRTTTTHTHTLLPLLLLTLFSSLIPFGWKKISLE